ncbi:MAG: hypothetical protein KA176_01280 [Alphaproteobacteria bacterium]|nr:hypothetical protein [Alphaproteobacteria bacterium]
MSDFTRETFRNHLKEMYECEYIGQRVAAAWDDDSDGGPDIFKPPEEDKDCFCVPLVFAEGGFYEQWVIDRTINDNNLKPKKVAYAVEKKKKE